MNKKQIQQLITNENISKNSDTLIKKLKSSLNLQKQFIKELVNIFMPNKIQNDINLINKIIELLPEIIEKLGIPFSHLFLKQNNIISMLVNLYYDDNDEKIPIILEKCIDTLSFSEIRDDVNNLKQHLTECGIIEKKEQNEKSNSIIKNSEQYIYESSLQLLNDLEKYQNEDKDKDNNINYSKLEKKYYNIIKDIKSLPSKMEINQAQIEFYLEILNPFKKDLDKKKKIEGINNFSNIGKSHVILKNNINYENEIVDENKGEVLFVNKENEETMKKELRERTFFYENEKIREKRNQVIEFKNYSLPLNQENGDELRRQICGFLNSQGGRLYIGIDDQNIVKGIVLNYKKRDNLRNALINLTYDFYPKCRLDKIFIYFIPIKSKKTQKFFNNLYIIKIRIYPGDPEYLYSMINVGYQSCIRENGICKNLNSTQIQKEIIERNEYQYMNNNEKYKFILKEKEIKDPEPEINYEDLERNDEPIFENNNLNNNIDQIIKEKGTKPKKKKNKNKKNSKDNNGIKEFVKVKVSNIDENIPLNEINKYFNKCKCSSRQFYKGYGYLEFSNRNSANDCIVNCNGDLFGNKRLSLKIVDDDEF